MILDHHKPTTSQQTTSRNHQILDWKTTKFTDWKMTKNANVNWINATLILLKNHFNYNYMCKTIIIIIIVICAKPLSMPAFSWLNEAIEVSARWFLTPFCDYKKGGEIWNGRTVGFVPSTNAGLQIRHWVLHWPFTRLTGRIAGLQIILIL